MIWHPLADVVADDVATEGNDRGVADDAVLENGDVRCTASDVDQGHACFFFFFGEHGSGGGERLEDELVHFEASLADALVDVLGRGHLAGDDVEVGFQANAAHADGVLDALFVVHSEFLRNHVQDFFPGLHHELVHVLDEGFDVVLADFRFEVLPGDESAVLQTLDVLPRDAHVHQSDLGPHLLLGLLHGLLDGCHRAVDVGHDAARHAHRFTSAVAEQFNLAKLIFLTNEAGNFRGSDVETDDDLFRVVGELVVHHG